MNSHWDDTTLSDLTRAPRYGIQVGMRYRAAGQSTWLDAQTENISRSGILFRVAEELKVSDVVEMRFMFPPGLTGSLGAEVLCQGSVVRVTPPAAGGKLRLFAAKILDYRLLRDREGNDGPGAAQGR